MRVSIRFPSTGPLRPPPWSFGSYQTLSGVLDTASGIVWCVVPENCNAVALRGKRVGIHLNTYAEIMPENQASPVAKASERDARPNARG